MAIVNVYLNFDGTCEAAFNFYKSVFGGDFPYISRYGEMPSPDLPIPDSEKNKIMHMHLPISKETMLMGSDVSEALGSPKLVQGNNYSICVTVKSEEEARRIFNTLSAGGRIEMPLQETFWGALFGTFTDKFGINWMIDYELPKK